MCVSDNLDPDEECDCIVTEPDYQKRKRMDWDGDFIHNKCDNCFKVVNADQRDRDGDSIGDACDKCPDDFSRGPEFGKDSDRDGIPDVCDKDTPPPYIQAEEEENDNDRSVIAAIMEKLLKMYNNM